MPVLLRYRDSLGGYMPESTIILINLIRLVFLMTNILLINTFLTPKRPVGSQIIAFTVTWVTGYLLGDFLKPVIPEPFLLYYLIGLLYMVPCALIFKETFHAKLFVFFMIYSLSQFALVIFMFLEHLVFNHIVGFLILFGLILELASLPFIKKYITPRVRDIIGVIDQQNPIFTLFPIFSSLLLAFFDVKRTDSLSTFMSLLLCTLLIVFTYYLIAKSIDQTRRHHQLEKQLALQRDHYHNLSNSITTAKANRHDLRHHLVILVELFGKNNSAAGQEYLNQLCHQYNDSSIPMVCSNQSADALICHYLKLAIQQDINLITTLHLPEDLGIDNVDLCVILGNCLENAIEACSKIKDDEPRFIDITTTITKGHLLIKIINSFNGLVQRQGDDFLSSKNDLNHGLGLSSVKILTAKYSGHCAISFDQKVFKVSISLKIPSIVTAPDNAKKLRTIFK